MKVLSLLQPWASMVVTSKLPLNPHRAIKQWETRSWQPSKKNLEEIIKDGLLIHASKGWKKSQKDIIVQEPFTDYLKHITPFPFGMIIGYVSVGRIITTEKWLLEMSRFEDGAAESAWEEKCFGNYNPGRYAWEFLTFKKFDKPLKIDGSLSLWNYNSSINEISR